MSSGNKSFFERLTGTVNLSNNPGSQPASQPQQQNRPADQNRRQPQPNRQDFQNEPNPNPAEPQPAEDGWGQTEETSTEDEAGELAIDMYETPNQVIIQTMAAGVRPEKLDVSISREQCTISGRREPPRDIPAEDYYHQELYWGAFSRSVELPVEVDVEEAEASETHGLLTVTLPKVDRHQETTLEINSSEM